jgi:hypothetical protein
MVTRSATDDVILDKLRRSIPGNTPPGELRGNWFTGCECVRLLELLGERASTKRAKPSRHAKPCAACGHTFDKRLGPQGCPNCHGEGLL